MIAVRPSITGCTGVDGTCSISTGEEEQGKKATDHLEVHEHDGVPTSVLGSGLDELERFGPVRSNVGGKVGFDELALED